MENHGSMKKYKYLAIIYGRMLSINITAQVLYI